MTSVQQAVTQGRVYSLFLAISLLCLILGGAVGFGLGLASASSTRESAREEYSKLMYNTCREQEKVLNGYNSQRARRDCTYLLPPNK